MPIISLGGTEAVQIRKKNEYATWGSRNEDNRIEPIVDPAFKVPFRLKKRQPIFTIGSCFARNVEGELINRGFRIPIRELFNTPEFKDLPPEIVNNFGTPSIYNELAWAFGEAEYDESANIIEVGTDKYVDLHMINSIRPAPLQTVLNRRHGLLNATRTLAECRVLIMTLGLVELWWDEDTRCYLNTAPLPTVLKRYPKRFVLHVLSFQECYDYLRKAMDIAFANAKKDLSVILTVSPVPMMATHRNVDVVTANSYSKSVLRAVAEHLVAEDRRITYFPSYETVTMSDRRFAWTDDFVHVNRKMIELNVDRMVNAFTGEKMRTTAVIPDLGTETGETADALFLAEEARLARLSGNTDFFAEHADAAESSPAFALELANFLYDAQQYEELLELTRNDERVEMKTLRARGLIANGQPQEAIEVIRPVCIQTAKGSEHWRAYVEAARAMRSKAMLLQAEAEWLENQPRHRGLIKTTVGRALRLIGENELAAERLSNAVRLPNASDATAIECAFALVALRRHGEAAEILKGITGNTAWQVKQLGVLRERIRRAPPR